MPIHKGIENNKYYYQWGSGKKYYFKTEIGEKRAYNKVIKQRTAAYANGYKLSTKSMKPTA